MGFSDILSGDHFCSVEFSQALAQTAIWLLPLPLCEPAWLAPWGLPMVRSPRFLSVAGDTVTTCYSKLPQPLVSVVTVCGVIVTCLVHVNSHK